jgi:hypothetical protein
MSRDRQHNDLWLGQRRRDTLTRTKVHSISQQTETSCNANKLNSFYANSDRSCNLCSVAFRCLAGLRLGRTQTWQESDLDYPECKPNAVHDWRYSRRAILRMIFDSALPAAFTANRPLSGLFSSKLRGCKQTIPGSIITEATKAWHQGMAPRHGTKSWHQVMAELTDARKNTGQSRMCKYVIRPFADHPRSVANCIAA